MTARARPPAAPQAESTAVAQARERLEAFLSGFGLTAGPAREALIGRLLASCPAAEKSASPGAFAAAALQHAEAQVQAWLRRILGEERIRDHSALLLGRMALCACEAASRWPQAFLSEQPPEEFLAAVRAVAPEATPPEEPGTMVEQPLESWSIASIGAVQRVIRLLEAAGRASIAS